MPLIRQRQMPLFASLRYAVDIIAFRCCRCCRCRHRCGMSRLYTRRRRYRFFAAYGHAALIRQHTLMMLRCRCYATMLHTLATTAATL